MDQNGLAGHQLPVAEQPLPRRLTRQWNGGRMRMVQRCRLTGDGLLVEHGLLGVPATTDADYPEYLVADLERGRLGAALLHDARHVASKGVRQAVFLDGRVLAASNLEIDWIYACRLHRHQDLGRVRKRWFDLVKPKHLRATEPVKAKLADC